MDGALADVERRIFPPARGLTPAGAISEVSLTILQTELAEGEPLGEPAASPPTTPSHGAAGTVFIAGTGPGDPDLLTVKAERLIRSAAVIGFDALISPAIQALFAPHSIRYDVGKRAGRADSTGQEQIDGLLARLARGGNDVLRLKGGDPLVFGRGGEEALVLGRQGGNWCLPPPTTPP